MFVYQPALLMIGDPLVILTALVSAFIGAMLLAAGLFGYLMGPCQRWQQVLLVAAAVSLIKPGLESDLLGLALVLPVLILQWRRMRAQAA